MDPVIVGVDMGPKLRDEQDNVAHVTVPLQLIAPQLRVFVPILRSVVRVDPLQQALNISAYVAAFTEHKVVNPPTPGHH